MPRRSTARPKIHAFEAFKGVRASFKKMDTPTFSRRFHNVSLIDVPDSRADVAGYIDVYHLIFPKP